MNENYNYCPRCEKLVDADHHHDESSQFSPEAYDIPLIFFEGVDRVGKSILMKNFNEQTKYKFLCFDRGPLSYFVYAEIFHRKMAFSEKMMSMILHRCIIIYVYCKEEILHKRILNDKHIMFDYSKHLKIFNEHVQRLKRYGTTIINIDTSYITPYQAAELTREKILEII